MSKSTIENELSKKSKNMTGKLPNQLDNKDYGKKRKAKFHKFNVVDTKTGKLYWSPAIAESFSQFLIQEANESKILDKLTSLPDVVISELKKLIRKGAEDLSQDWKHAAELVNTAYKVANIRRPNPDQRGAWKNYEDLLKYGVKMMYNVRGPKGKWRNSNVVYAESISSNIPSTLLTEQQLSHRFFIKIPNTMDVEVEAHDIGEIIRELTNKIRRHGARLEVEYKTREGAVLAVWKNDQKIEEVIVQSVS